MITGCTGFVGQYFIDYVQRIDPKSEILGIGRSPTFYLSSRAFHYQQLDLNNKQPLTALINEFNPSYVLHFASMSSVSKSWLDPAGSFVNNTNIFLNLLEALKASNCNAKILSIGSSEEYGPHNKMPLTEDIDLRPNSPYAIARVSQEMISKLYADNFGMQIVMTRSFNHIGPKQRDIFVIPSIIKQLILINSKKTKALHVGNLDIIRDFLDVRDVVTAYYNLLKFGNIGEVYNVCSGQGTSIRNILELLVNMLNISPNIVVDSNRIRPSDCKITIGDNSKLRRAINWKPTFSIQQTLLDMINYAMVSEQLQQSRYV